MNIDQVTIQGNTYRLGREKFIVDLTSPCFQKPHTETFDNEKETFEWVARRLDEEGIRVPDVVKIRQYTYLEGEPSPVSSRKIELNGSIYTFRSGGEYIAKCLTAGPINQGRPESHNCDKTFPTKYKALKGLAEHCQKYHCIDEEPHITHNWYLSIEY